MIQRINIYRMPEFSSEEGMVSICMGGSFRVAMNCMQISENQCLTWIWERTSYYSWGIVSPSLNLQGRVGSANYCPWNKVNKRKKDEVNSKEWTEILHDCTRRVICPEGSSNNGVWRRGSSIDQGVHKFTSAPHAKNICSLSREVGEEFHSRYGVVL